MHRTSKRTLSLLRSRVQVRSAATAVKPAPSKWAPPEPTPAPNSQPASARLSKWARPADTASPSGQGSSGKWSPTSRTSSATPSDTSSGKRARPPPPSSDRSFPEHGSRSAASGPAKTRYGEPTKQGSRNLERDAPPHAGIEPVLSGRTPRAEIRDSQKPPTPWLAGGYRAPTQRGRERPASKFQEQPKAERQSYRDNVVQTGASEEQRGGRRAKASYKERGSLVQMLSEDVGDSGPAWSSSKSRTAAPVTKVVKQKKSKAELRRPAKINVFIPSTISVGNLARLLKVRMGTLQRVMRQAGMGEESSYDHVLTSDYAALLAEEFNRNPVINDEAAFDIFPAPPHPDPSTLPSRPPIVTIMGHVDHGKTTLLDKLRSTSVASGEAGGITQHIGAFSVSVPNSSGSGETRSITFLDTPGHAAFSAMRARGASVTDIVVLVVAADDGVKPQTKEVIELFKKDEANVQLVVAINKVDRPGVDIEKVHHSLLVEDVHLEAIGGDIPSVEVSGLTGQGLDQLVETISAVAEMQDLRAEREGNVEGHVLESKVQKGLGPVATVLISRGCLKPGTHIICGTTFAKVRVMNDAAGQSVKAAYPGMAVTVSGWKELPKAGDEVLQGSEQDVKKAVVNRERKAEEDALLTDVEAINSQRRLDRDQRELEVQAAAQGTTVQVERAADDGPKELRLVIKGDVSGSVEALVCALEGIGNKLARVKIVSTGVGEVTESDVLRAKAAEGMIVAFSVPVPRSSAAAAGSSNVPIFSSAIIYKVMDEVTEHVTALLPTEYDRRIVAEATVLQLFDIQLGNKRFKKVAGSRITNGILQKSKPVQVVRAGTVVYEGHLDTFRHLKKDLTEASKGLECGISIQGFQDLREGDTIQGYENVEKPKVLY